MPGPAFLDPSLIVSRDLQALIDAVPGISMLVDATGSLLAINAAGLAHLGLSHDAALGRDAFGLADDPVMIQRRAIFEEVVARGQAIECEDERAGRLYRHKVIPVPDETGRVLHVALFSEDITDAQRMQRELALSEARYRFIAEHADDIIWQLDADMRFTYLNPANEKIRGYRNEELLGQSVMTLYTPEGLEIVRRVMRERDERIARGTDSPAVCFEVPQYRRDGSVIWVETTSSRITDGQGRLLGYVGITRDVDARVRDRAALEEAHHQLKLRLEEISSLQARLWQQAVRDALTGLYNRHYLHDVLQRELARAARLGHPVSVVLLDVDHFKQINDTYGHRVGDIVLREVAHLLQAQARESDVICRWGGEEFLVLLPAMSLAQAQARTESWRAALATHGLDVFAPGLRVTASFGCASYPQDASQGEALIHCADLALYESKRLGRNRVTSYAKVRQGDPSP